MTKLSGVLFASVTLVAACGGDDGGAPLDPLFPTKPECEGAPITAYAGTQPQAISKLEIGATADGFDLDGDGKPDNKLAAVASIANGSVKDSLANYEIVIPFEFFDLAAPAAEDSCVKFALYLGDYVTDTDADGKKAFVENGDCNDNDAMIRPGAAEVAGNFKDDDCDGLADEDGSTPPVESTDIMDRDADGVTLADGDCDDTSNAVKPGAVELCNDGLDNDCDGTADRTEDALGVATACSPFDPGKADIPLDPLSFQTGTQTPIISFYDGVISTVDGKLQLDAGPSLFSVAIPVTDGLTLDLKISGASIRADVVTEGTAIVLKNARLGGIIDARTADTIRGLDVDQIGLKPEDSLLDAAFANLLGPLLALPKASVEIGEKYAGCRTPDIDVDRDGLEAFCDSNPDDLESKVVDVCIDGDGTEVRDVLDAAGAILMECTLAEVDGKPRFVDGISVALKFDTTAIKSIQAPR